MSLSLALDAALSGLITAQRQTALTSRNIANASTPGYTRKEAELASRTIQGEGRGVMVADIVRKVDTMLQQDVRRESGLSAELQTKADGLAAFTTAIGQPDEERWPSKVTAHRLKALGVIDKIVNEPVGGAHRDTKWMAAHLKRGLNDALRQVVDLKPKELLQRRYERLQSYGRFGDTKER